MFSVRSLLYSSLLTLYMFVVLSALRKTLSDLFMSLTMFDSFPWKALLLCGLYLMFVTRSKRSLSNGASSGRKGAAFSVLNPYVFVISDFASRLSSKNPAHLALYVKSQVLANKCFSKAGFGGIGMFLSEQYNLKSSMVR